MSAGRFLAGGWVVGLGLAVAVTGAIGAGGALLVDGDFTTCATSRIMRVDTKGQQDWYESRHDGKPGPAYLMVSKKAIAGNPTPKAMIKANMAANTYLTQELAGPQKSDFVVQFDICVKEILPKDNRSAFFMVGNDTDKKGGPNSTGVERFVFMGFENSLEKGKLNLFAREGKTEWAQKTIVAKGLDPKRWYTIEVTVHPGAAAYDVIVKGVTPAPVKVAAFGAKPPMPLTHLSFASWNDGAGTFYVDNVAARAL